MSFRSCLTVGIIVAVLVLGFWIYWAANNQWIEAGYVGVVYTPSGGLNGAILKPGRHWIPPYHQLYVYPTMTKAAVYTQDPDVGEERAADGVAVNTNDNANTTYDVAIFYRVNPENVVTAFKEFGAHDMDYIQANHIRRALREATNAVGPNFDAFELMGVSREKASRMLVTELRKRLSYKGITIEKAFFCQAHPSDQLQQKVNGQVNSLTELTIAGIHNQIAWKEKTAAITLATAKSTAAHLTSARSNPLVEKMLAMDAAEAAAKNWKGYLSPITARSGQMISIPRDVLTALQQAQTQAPTTTEEEVSK